MVMFDVVFDVMSDMVFGNLLLWPSLSLCSRRIANRIARRDKMRNMGSGRGVRGPDWGALFMVILMVVFMVMLVVMLLVILLMMMLWVLMVPRCLMD